MSSRKCKSAYVSSFVVCPCVHTTGVDWHSLADTLWRIAVCTAFITKQFYVDIVDIVYVEHMAQNIW